jgi:hypothetical protein
VVRRDGYFTEMKSRTWLFCLIFAFVPFSENEVNPRSIHYQPPVFPKSGTCDPGVKAAPLFGQEQC